MLFRLEKVWDRGGKWEAVVVERAGLQVMMAAIATSADLVAWANRNLGWSKPEAVAHLEEKFGKLTSKRLGEYAEWLYEQANGGKGQTRLRCSWGEYPDTSMERRLQGPEPQKARSLEVASSAWRFAGAERTTYQRKSAIA